MTTISERGQLMPSSPIRKLVPFAEKARAKGINVLHLNIGQPDIETPPEFFEAIQNMDTKILEYSHSAGIPEYRSGLVRYYEKHNIHINKDNIIVTTGGSEALRFAFLACLNPGDEVIIPEPFYANYNGFGVDTGVVVQPVTTLLEDDFDLPSPEEFEAVVNSKTKAILICNPGNPTGKLYSLKALSKLKEIALKHNLFLIADEVYREFCYDGYQHHSILNLEGMEENAIVIDSISKRYSACGARVGAFVTRNQKVMDTVMRFAQARLSPPTLGQIGANAVIDLPDSYFEKVNAEYKNRRDILVQGLSEIPGVKTPIANGAFYMVLSLPVKNTEDFCQWMLEEFSYKGNTVMMAPGSGFYATKGLGLNEVRIAYVLNADALKLALECLKEGLRVYSSAVPSS